MEINREERFYCFLVCHAILSSGGFRKGFLNLIEGKYNVNLDQNGIEIYPEAAVLRDYWHNLGNPKKYDKKTNERRRSLLGYLLINYVNLPESTIDENRFFWTNYGKPNNKLWSPGHWDLKSINGNGFKEGQIKKLYDIKYAFNCKPDIMLVSNDTIILFEAKVESKIGRNNQGYDQYETQIFLGKLLKDLVPIYNNGTFLNILINHESNKENISWEELVCIMNDSDIDQFSRKSFGAVLK